MPAGYIDTLWRGGLTLPVPPTPRILFTAFEPSGDDHASAVIAELRTRHPDLELCAWGGPKMERAGATIIERTGEEAVMGVPGLAKLREHQQINRRIAAWMDANPVTVHVPVDSPGANFAICKIAKKRGIRVVHLVAPQLWAWGSWRIRKLRRRTDQVLCLLPFEESWFRSREVDARFIGHPLFDDPIDIEAADEIVKGLPQGSPKLALFPGSRPAEWRKNFPVLIGAFRELRKRHPEATGVIAATTPQAEALLRKAADDLGGWPEGLDTIAGQTDAVVHWCDLAIVVSGTVTLQIAKQLKPMVIFYKYNPILYGLVGSWLLVTEFYTLPNLVAGREIVPELTPHFGDETAIVNAADKLIRSPEAAQAQRDALSAMVDQFKDKRASELAADAILKMAGLGPKAG